MAAACLVAPGRYGVCLPWSGGRQPSGFAALGPGGPEVWSEEWRFLTIAPENPFGPNNFGSERAGCTSAFQLVKSSRETQGGAFLAF